MVKSKRLLDRDRETNFHKSAEINPARAYAPIDESGNVTNTNVTK
jgi:hypothetical protein